MHLAHLKVAFHISVSAHGKEPDTSGWSVQPHQHHSLECQETLETLKGHTL